MFATAVKKVFGSRNQRLLKDMDKTVHSINHLEPGVAAHDARDGNLTTAVTVTGTVDANSTGTYVLTYSVSDAAGHEVHATRTVTVSAPTDPVATLLGAANLPHTQGATSVAPGPTPPHHLNTKHSGTERQH